MINKKIKARIKLQITARLANPSPPIGPALGQQGINIMEFCKEFNSRTEALEKGLLVSVIIAVYVDRSFSFIIKTSPTSFLLKKAAGIKLGSSKPKMMNSGKILMTQIYDIAKIKSIDMTGSDLQSVSKSIVGTAHSIGLEVIE